MSKVLCDSCGQRVPVPAGYSRSRMRCPACGVICDVPAPAVEDVPTCPECGDAMRGEPPSCRRCRAARIAPAEAIPPRARPTPPAIAEAAIEVADEDDDKPYQVPPDPDPKDPCPACRKLLPRGAVVCNHCGFNRETGVAVERVHEKLDQQWDTGPGLRVRFSVFLGVQGILLAVMLVLAVADGNVLSWTIAWLFGAMVMAFVLGSYPRVNLARSKRGKVRLTRTFRIAFIPLSAADIRWREYEGIVTAQTHETGFLDWLIVVFLFPFGVVPAVLWWLFIMQPDQYNVSLARDHGCPVLLLFRGRSQATAMEIAATIRKVTGLP